MMLMFRRSVLIGASYLAPAPLKKLTSPPLGREREASQQISKLSYGALLRVTNCQMTTPITMLTAIMPIMSHKLNCSGAGSASGAEGAGCTVGGASAVGTSG